MTKRLYAAETTVAVEKTRGEIEQLLRKHGCDQLAYAWESGRAALTFRLDGRTVRMAVPLEPEGEPTAKQREQFERSRWRAVLLIVKAKLEAVAAGISSVEREFLADVVTPGGRTVEQWIGQSLATALSSGRSPQLPALLLSGPEEPR
ncbi:MAG TPA: hypothetical protein VGE52_12335 [Pirellulales bacterium]